MTTLTINGVELTIPEGMTMTVSPEGTMTLTSVPEAPAKTGSKSRKSAPKGRKGGRKARLVRSTNIAAFGETLGYDLSDWSLQDFLDSLRLEGFEAWGLPEGKLTKGWAFGPASIHYLAEGEWPTK